MKAALDDSDDRDRTIGVALALANELADNKKRAVAVAACSDGKNTGPAWSLLRAALDKADGAATSKHADTFLKLVEKNIGPEVGWWISAFLLAAPLATNPRFVLDAGVLIEERDPYHRGVLAAMASAWKATGREASDADIVRREKMAAELERLSDVMLKLWVNAEPKDVKAGYAAFKKLSDADQATLVKRMGARSGIFAPPALVQRALDAALDDEDISPRTLAFSVQTLQSAQDEDHALDAWKARVKGGDKKALSRILDIVRAATASDVGVQEDQWENLLRVLAPRAHDPDVFALVDVAFPKKNEPALLELQKGMLDTWFQRFDDEGGFAMPCLSNEQMDHVVRVLLQYARNEDYEEARATRNRIFYIDHPGAERAVAEALAVEKNEDLIGDLYSALANMTKGSATARRALVERLGVEMLEPWRLADAIHDSFTPELHAAALAYLDENKARAKAVVIACQYADTFHAYERNPKALLDVARAVLDWPRLPTSGDDARRLKMLWLESAAAALEVRDDALAVRCWRAQDELKLPKGKAGAPLSDYRRIRDSSWADPFTDPKRKTRLDDALAGKTTSARAATAKATAKGAKLSDDDLGALFSCTVAERWHDDQASKSVWFVDTLGKFHIWHDGNTCDGAGLEGFNLGGEFLQGHATSERAMQWAGSTFREVRRHDDRLILHTGTNNGTSIVVGFSFPSSQVAQQAFASFAGKPAKGFAATSPFYIPGKGAVRREWTHNKTGDERWRWIAVLGSRWVGSVPRSFASAQEAEQALQVWECAEWANGAWLTKVEIEESAKLDDDVTLATWAEDRIREDDKDAAWHLRAMTEIEVALRAAGIFPRELVVRVDKGASAADVAAYAAVCPDPLPSYLTDCWREVGGASWQWNDEPEMRFLSPREVIERRQACRHVVAAVVKKHAGFAERLAAVDPIVVRGDEPITIYDVTVSGDDERHITHFDRAHPDHLWWEKALGWIFATQLLSDFYEKLVLNVPELSLLRRGRSLQDTTIVKLGKAGKFWRAAVDGAVVVTHHGKNGTRGQPSLKRHADDAAARAAFDKAVKAKRADGYV